MKKYSLPVFVVFIIFMFSLATYANDNWNGFPETGQYNMANVKNYGAVGDGVTDDTAAVQAALNSGGSNVVYFPEGVYKVSSQLEYPYKRIMIIGDGSGKSIIRLADNAVGFESGVIPLLTPVGAEGSVFDAFKTGFYHLGIEIGSGNYGAAGIQFLSNNQGGMRDVSIKRMDSSQESIGILMDKSWPGPSLFQQIQISGFSVGVKVSCCQYSITFDDILINNCMYGISNGGNAVSINKFITQDVEYPLYQNERSSMTVMTECEFSGNYPSNAAVLISAGYVVAKNVNVSGFGYVIDDSTTYGGKFEGPEIKLYYNNKEKGMTPYTLSDCDESLIDLKVPEYSIDYGNPSDWKNAIQDGGVVTTDKNDDTAKLQALFNSGASVIFLPKNESNDSHGYYISDTIIIPETVKAVYGANCKLHLSGLSDGTKPVFKIEGGGEPLVIEGFWVHSDAGDAHMFDIDAERDVILRNISEHNIRTNNSDVPDITARGSGNLFLEDLAIGRVEGYKKNIYAKQLNIEVNNIDYPMVLNDGGCFYVLGYKTERRGVCIQTINGGKTEWYGGLVYPTAVIDDDLPIIINDNSYVNASFCTNSYESDYESGKYYKTIVKEIKSGVTKKLTRTELPSRIYCGNFLTMYVGKAETTDQEDFSDIYGNNYIVWTNEDNENHKNACTDFGKWESNNFIVERADDEIYGKVRVFTKKEDTLNYKRYQITDDAWKDVSSYRYMSFLYKGDGTKNTISLVFRKSSAGEVVHTVTLNVEGSSWKKYILDMNDWQGSKTDINYMNVSLKNNGTVYIDNLAFFTPDYELGDILIDSGQTLNGEITAGEHLISGTVTLNDNHDVIIAVYSPDGRLNSVKLIPVQSGIEVPYSQTVIAKEDNSKISVMLWDMIKIRALTEKKE